MEKSSVSLLPGIFLAIAGVVGFNLLIYGSFGEAGIATWMLAGVVGLYAWVRGKNRNLAMALGGVGALAWLGIVGRANEFVQVLNFGLMLGVMVFLILVGSVDKIRWRIVELLKIGLEFGLGLLPHTFNVLGAVFTARETQNKKLGSVLKVVIIGIVLVVVFGGLLFASDQVFAKLLGDFLQDIWGRVIASIVVGGAVLVVTTQRLKADNDETKVFGWLSGSELAGAILFLEILFGGFLLVQARYLFASHEVFNTLGITYSDYVRQGFFQLIAAVSLGGVVSYVLGSKLNPEKFDWTKLVSLILILELGLILLSAWWRNGLYIDMHGLTRIRIVGEVGVWALVGLLALLLGREVYRQLDEKKFLMGLGAIIVMAVGYINFTNMDMQIVANPPIRHERPDYFVIGNLSTDAVVGWEMAINEGSQLALQLNGNPGRIGKEDDLTWRVANARLGLIAIAGKRNYLVNKYKDTDWRKFNVSEYMALTKMQQDRSLYFDTLDETIRQLANVANSAPLLKDTERYILNDFDYPLMNITR